MKWMLSFLSQYMAACENEDLKSVVLNSLLDINQSQKKKGKENIILSVNIKSIFQFTRMHKKRTKY